MPTYAPLPNKIKLEKMNPITRFFLVLRITWKEEKGFFAAIRDCFHLFFSAIFNNSSTNSFWRKKKRDVLQQIEEQEKRQKTSTVSTEEDRASAMKVVPLAERQKKSDTYLRLIDDAAAMLHNVLQGNEENLSKSPWHEYGIQPGWRDGIEKIVQQLKNQQPKITGLENHPVESQKYQQIVQYMMNAMWFHAVDQRLIDMGKYDAYMGIYNVNTLEKYRDIFEEFKGWGWAGVLQCHFEPHSHGSDDNGTCKNNPLQNLLPTNVQITDDFEKRHLRKIALAAVNRNLTQQTQEEDYPEWFEDYKNALDEGVGITKNYLREMIIGNHYQKLRVRLNDTSSNRKPNNIETFIEHWMNYCAEHDNEENLRQLDEKLAHIDQAIDKITDEYKNKKPFFAFDGPQERRTPELIKAIFEQSHNLAFIFIVPTLILNALNKGYLSCDEEFLASHPFASTEDYLSNVSGGWGHWRVGLQLPPELRAKVDPGTGGGYAGMTCLGDAYQGHLDKIFTGLIQWRNFTEKITRNLGRQYPQYENAIYQLIRENKSALRYICHTKYEEDSDTGQAIEKYATLLMKVRAIERGIIDLSLEELRALRTQINEEHQKISEIITVDAETAPNPLCNIILDKIKEKQPQYFKLLDDIRNKLIASHTIEHNERTNTIIDQLLLNANIEGLEQYEEDSPERKRIEDYVELAMKISLMHSEIIPTTTNGIGNRWGENDIPNQAARLPEGIKVVGDFDSQCLRKFLGSAKNREITARVPSKANTPWFDEYERWLDRCGQNTANYLGNNHREAINRIVAYYKNKNAQFLPDIANPTNEQARNVFNQRHIVDFGTLPLIINAIDKGYFVPTVAELDAIKLQFDLGWNYANNASLIYGHCIGDGHGTLVDDFYPGYLKEVLDQYMEYARIWEQDIKNRIETVLETNDEIQINRILQETCQEFKNITGKNDEYVLEYFTQQGQKDFPDRGITRENLAQRLDMRIQNPNSCTEQHSKTTPFPAIHQQPPLIEGAH